MFAYANGLIAVSRDMIGQLVRMGAPREKIFYNPYGVEVSQFKPVPRKPSLQVIAVGRFVEKKAPYLTIIAFKKVLERVPEAKLVMVGSGPLHDVCRQLIKSLHIDHAVDLKGVLDQEHVAALMEQSCMFVQHSLTPRSGDSEGTPLAILEAGASGLPIVSTRHAGIMDAVVDGETGFLVDEGDVDGMAQHMYQLLTDPHLIGKMGSRGREYIAENFNVNASIKNLEDILDQYRR
jgi:glycosyltransferase involved in cell wall biosynthesis